MKTEPIAIGFSSVRGIKFFRSEWKRRIGGVFKPKMVKGERTGYFLRTVFELNAAREIEQLRPGTVRGLPKQTQ